MAYSGRERPFPSVSEGISKAISGIVLSRFERLLQVVVGRDGNYLITSSFTA